MTTLQADSPYWQSAIWLALVGIGSGMFNSPNTAAMMGTVPPHRRGIAAGARMMLQNTGAVLSIAFVLAIITSVDPEDVLFKIFSGVRTGSRDAQLEPFIHNMHDGAVGAGRHLAGRRRRVAPAPRAAPRRAVAATAEVAGDRLRIGEVAKRRRARRRARSATTRRSASSPAAATATAGRAPHLRRGATWSACAS